MTSLLTPSSTTTHINRSAVLGYREALPIPDGFRIAYIDQYPVRFKDELLKTEEVYALHDVYKTTPKLREIINSGRLVVLQFKDGLPLGILIHPRLQLISDISQFILFVNKDSAAFLLPKFGITRSTEDSYRKMSLIYLGAL